VYKVYKPLSGVVIKRPEQNRPNIEKNINRYSNQSLLLTSAHIDFRFYTVFYGAYKF